MGEFVPFIPIIFAVYTDGQGSKQYRKLWDTPIIKSFYIKIDKGGIFHGGTRVCRGNSL